MRKKEDAKPSKVKKVLQTVTTILLILSTVLCFAIVIRVSQKKDVSVFNFRIFYVKTQSMEPTISAGSFLLVKESDNYEVNDIITFYSKDESIKGYPNTHRIVDTSVIDGKLHYITKGDNVDRVDNDPVPPEDVLGKVCFCIDNQFFGKIMEFLGTPIGFMTVILLPNLLIAISCMTSFIKAMKEEMQKAVLESTQQEHVEEEECQKNENEKEDTTE